MATQYSPYIYTYIERERGEGGSERLLLFMIEILDDPIYRIRLQFLQFSMQDFYYQQYFDPDNGGSVHNLDVKQIPGPPKYPKTWPFPKIMGIGATLEVQVCRF